LANAMVMPSCFAVGFQFNALAAHYPEARRERKVSSEIPDLSISPRPSSIVRSN
jgi:hypothetical protein